MESEEIEILKRDLLKYIDDNQIINPDGSKSEDVEKRIAVIMTLSKKDFDSFQDV